MTTLTYDDACQEIPWPDDGPDLSDAERAAAEAAAVDAEHDLRRRYHAAYTHYADRFRDVIDEEARTIDGLTTGGPTRILRVPIEVIAETDPEAWGRGRS